jgi:hypothetical protein
VFHNVNRLGSPRMATFIPSIGTSAFDSAGERRLAERLEQKLDDNYLSNAHKEGHAWGDMAILCADALYQRKLPFNVRKKTGQFDPSADTIQIMTMHASKGLEFPVVALPGVGHMPAAGDDEQEAARVFYVAATRATQRLVIGVGGNGMFGKQLEQ